MTPYETAKARVESGDFSLDAIGALTIAHAEQLRASFERGMANDATQRPPFDAHNCSVCRNGAKPCTASVVGNCGNLMARND